MKKFITLALALILVLSMAVVSFAEEAKLEAAGDQTVSVKGQYIAGEAADTISVSISWINATWTYSVQNVWNDTTFEEEILEAGVWANAADAEGVDAKTEITVTNKSNVAITTEYEVEAKAAGAVGTLSNDASELRAANADDGAASETVTLDMSGELTGTYEDDAEFEIAVVTITIAKKAA